MIGFRIAFGILVCATAAQAQTTTVQFRGQVTGIGALENADFPDAQLGDDVILRVAVSSQTSPFSALSFDVVRGESSVQVGDRIVSFIPGGPSSFFYSPCDHGFDWVSSSGTFLNTPSGNSPSSLNYNGGCFDLPDDWLATEGDPPFAMPSGGVNPLQIGSIAATMDFLFVGDGEQDLGGGLGLYCSPAIEHHQGGSATLATSSFLSGSTMDLHLEATGGPTNQFGFFFMGPGFGPPFTVFNGTFCLSQPIARYNSQAANNQGLPALNSIGQFDASGVMQNLSGTSSTGTGFDVPLALPYSPAGQMIAPGDTWYFQFWYRDLDDQGQSTANYSDALSATFN
jgi:hypothetical protein